MCINQYNLSKSENAYPIGCELQFPGKLHDLMTFVEQEGLFNIVSWVRSGLAIKVHNRTKLVELLPRFFSQSKYRSFERQLNMWKFERIFEGRDRGAFRHPYFIKGQKSLCRRMTRQNFQCDSPAKQRATLNEQVLLARATTRNESWSSMSSSIKKDDTISSSPSSLWPCPTKRTIDSHRKTATSDFEDGDLLTFAGRQFYFVDQDLQGSSSSPILPTSACSSAFEVSSTSAISQHDNVPSQPQFENFSNVNASSNQFVDKALTFLDGVVRELRECKSDIADSSSYSRGLESDLGEALNAAVASF